MLTTNMKDILEKHNFIIKMHLFLMYSYNKVHISVYMKLARYDCTEMKDLYLT